MSNKKDIRQASQIWSALDNLAKTDPTAYREYIKDQLEQGKKMTSPPEPDLLIHINARKMRGVSIYIVLCSWSRLPPAVNDDDPLNVIGGKPYMVTDDKSLKTVQTMIYPLAFPDEVVKKYGSCSTNNEAQLELIEMSIEFLKKEKKVDIDTNSVYEICSVKLVGSVESLHSSFDYKPFNPETEFKETFGDLSISKEITLVKEEADEEDGLPELRIKADQSPSARNKVLIEEVDVPVVSVDERSRQVRVEVSVPRIQSLGEVELDLSETLLHLEIPSQPAFRPLHLALQRPIIVTSASARFLRKQSKLIVVADLK